MVPGRSRLGTDRDNGSEDFDSNAANVLELLNVLSFEFLRCVFDQVNSSKLEQS